MTEKINRIDMSDGLIERPKISPLKRKYSVLTSNTDRKKETSFCRTIWRSGRCYQAVPLRESVFDK